MLVAVSLLAISLSILVYRHPPSTWPSLFSPPTPPTTPAKTEQPQVGSAKQHTPADEQQEQPQVQTERETEALCRPSLSPHTTPKATARNVQNGASIPTFTLAAHESSDEEEEDPLPPPSFPAVNSAQRASTQPPALMAPLSKPPPSSLMPPPPRIVPSTLRALPTPSQSMRVPTTGPLPNRGPAPHRGPPVSSGGLDVPTAAGAPVKTPNTRGKVLLSPGHSPLDWANLQRSGRNLSGVDTLIRVTPSMLKHNNGRKGKPAWSNYQGKVYNITPYLPFHPGGEGELRRAAGKDGTKLFMEVHPWVNWDNMLGECLVGIMVAEEQSPKENGASLEDMD